MRLFAAFCLVLSACPSGPTLGGDASLDGSLDVSHAEGFSVVTWNIQEYPRTFLSQALVREIIQRRAWDVIAIQEISDVTAFEQLVATLPEYEGVISQEPAVLRNAILYRPARVSLENVGPIFADDRYAFPRNPLRADVTFRGALGGDDYRCRLVVLHLKASSSEEDRLRRLDAMTKLHAWAVESAELGEEHIIFAGDFNDSVTDVAGENVYGAFLGDEYQVLSSSLAATSFVPLRPLIDHIIVTDDVASDFQTSAVVINGQDEVINYDRNVSDHLPVEAHFTRR